MFYIAQGKLIKRNIIEKYSDPNGCILKNEKKKK